MERLSHELIWLVQITLLSSPLMVCELAELSSEFSSISTGYDDAWKNHTNLPFKLIIEVEGPARIVIRTGNLEGRQIRISLFHEHYRIPTPPGPVTLPVEPPQCVRRRVETHSTPTQTSITPRTNQSLGSRVYKAIAASTAAKLVLVLSLLAALAALIYAGVFGATFGPHLIYVEWTTTNLRKI
ncbi:hypothetical protein COOONC_16105 [Cooperia oncophora]